MVNHGESIGFSGVPMGTLFPDPFEVRSPATTQSAAKKSKECSSQILAVAGVISSFQPTKQGFCMFQTVEAVILRTWLRNSSVFCAKFITQCMQCMPLVGCSRKQKS